jgi:hypothetical protein
MLHLRLAKLDEARLFRRRPMPSPAYDIFKKKDSQLTWVEAAQDLESAKKRIEQLAKQTRDEYVVYDQRKKCIVATFR